MALSPARRGGGRKVRLAEPRREANRRLAREQEVPGSILTLIRALGEQIADHRRAGRPHGELEAWRNGDDFAFEEPRVDAGRVAV